MRVFDLLKTRIERMEEKNDVKGLILALKDDDEQIRQESARALGKIGSKEAIEPLTQTLQDPDKGVKEEAITALGKIGDPQATPPLINALNSQYIAIRWRAAQALGKIGSKEAIEPLTQTLQDPDKGVKEEAITALGKIGDPQATPPLINALNSQYIAIRWRAAQALGKIGSKEAIEPLTQTLQDPDKRVKEEAITALGRITIKPLLKDLQSNDSGIKDDAIITINRVQDLKSSEMMGSTISKTQDKSGEPQKEKHTDRLKEKTPMRMGKKPLEKTQKKPAEKLIEKPEKKPMKKPPKKHPEKSKTDLNQVKDEEKLIDKESSEKGTSHKLESEIKEGKQSIEKVDEVDESPKISPTNKDFEFRQKQLKDKGYYHIIEKFVRKSKYDYLENFVPKSRYDYQFSDLQKLKVLLEYRGIKFQDEEILWLIQEEIEEQKYQEFQNKILENQPTTIQQYLENYIKNYPQETPQNLKNLKKLLQKQKIHTPNLEKQIQQTRQQKEIQEFENKILEPSHQKTPEEKGSPSILIKFIKKELFERRDVLISTGDYHYIENFVQMAKNDYQIGDLQKLKVLLEYRGIKFQDEEILWLIQEEIEEQKYQEFQNKILENQPTTIQQYLENYIKNYPQETPQNLKNLKKLLQKQKIHTPNLEKQIQQTRQQKEIQEFENKILKNHEPVSISIPLIESKVAQDKALKKAQILCNLGNLFYDLGKPDEALKYYDKSISIHPEYIEAWKNKGLIFYTMGMPQKAVSCYSHVLKIDPEYKEVWLDIGVIIYEMGKLKEAKICYDKSLELHPGDKEVLSNYTRRFLQNNQYYLNNFEKFMDLVSSSDIAEESSDSLSPISKIMQMINQ